MAVNQSVAHDPVEDGVPVKVENSASHLVELAGPILEGVHGEPDVLEDVDVNVGEHGDRTVTEHEEKSVEDTGVACELHIQPDVEGDTKANPSAVGYSGPESTSQLLQS